MSLFLLLSLVAGIMWLLTRDRIKGVPERAYWMVAIFGAIFIHPLAALFANDSSTRIYQFEAFALTIVSLVVIFKLKNHIFPIHKVGAFLLMMVVILHCIVTLEECGYLRVGLIALNKKYEERLYPRFRALWDIKEKWYESQLYGTVIGFLPNPGYGLKALVIEPKRGLYAFRFVLKATRFGVMTRIVLSENEGFSINETLKEHGLCSYDWILAGPLEDAEFGKGQAPNFKLLIQEFKSSFQPQTIVIREGRRIASFLFFIKK